LGKVTVWNQATEKLTGYSAEEMMGHTLAMEGCETAIAMLLSCRSSSELSVALRSKQGRYIDVKIRASTQHSHSGELEGLIFLAEATLPTTCINGNGRCNCRSPENSFTEKANTPMFGISRDGLVTFWNRKAEEVTGVSQEQVLQTKFLTYLSESDGEAFLEYLRHLEGGLLPPNFSVNFPRSSGQPLKLLLNVSLWEEDQYFIIAHELPCLLGDADVLLTTFPDVVHEIRMLIDQVNIPVFGVDVNGDVNEWNEKMVKLTGFSKFEAFDVNFVQTFVTPKLQHGLADIFRNAVNGIGTSTYELELETKEGEVRVILLNISTRRNVRGEVVGVLCVAEDIPVTAQHDFTVAATARELRQLVDTANVPIFGIDVDGNVNEWNEKTAEITGFSAEEAFKRPLVATFVVRKLREAVQDMFNKAVHGHGTCNYELEMCTKGGESRTLLVNAAARRDIEKRIVGVVVVAHDVTEESKHARAVAAWASELRQLIDTANVPIFGIDADGDVNEWNDQMAEITGFTKSEAFDCNLVETFIVSSFRDSVEEVLKNALEGKGTSNYELEFQTKSNDIRHLLVNATTRRDADGNINGVLGVAQDVSEAVQRDRAVASMASELRLLIETANAPIFGIDCEGNVNEWNKKISEISGYEEEEAFDEPLVDVFIVARMRHQVQGIMNKALRGIETTNFELEMIAKTGDLRILLVNATTRRDPDGKVVGGKAIMKSNIIPRKIS
jgi:PAS domain S-box-containing protein